MCAKSHSIDSVYERRLGKKLALIEELRAELGTEGIECPGVLVVGAQSAGKSSVLERLTDIAFPHAENTCTRVPTIVQLQTDENAEIPVARVSRDADFKEAISCDSMKEIQEGIIRVSDQITNEVCPIKDEPIHIQYTRKAGPVMTLIDLPGITHVDVNNDAFDIHGVTAGMVKKYVANDNMVVLVVIPANDDFGNSEALRIAQEFDPDGVRTIGVVSKCDLVPERSDIVLKIQMSRQSDVKLALGFIAVRNKGPGEEEIDIRSSEESLFLSHPLLSQLSEEQRGYSSLTKKIVDLQSERVDKFIPEAYKLVETKTKQLQGEITRLGHAPESTNDRRLFLTKLLCKTSEIITSLIRAENVPKPHMNISARSYEIAATFGAKVRSQVPTFLSENYREKLNKLIVETVGHSLPNFMNDSIFRNQVHEALFSQVFDVATEDLVLKTRKLVLSVYREVLLGMNWHSQFPRLVESICNVIEKRLETATSRTKQITGAILVAEKAQVFTQNTHYMESIYKAKELISEIAKNSYKTYDNESRGLGIDYQFLRRFAQAGKHDTEPFNLQLSIHCYVDVVLKRLFDVIPMVVRNMLVFETSYDFHSELQAAFSTEDSLRKLLSEPPGVAAMRDNLSRRIVSMTSAMKKLQASEQ